MILVYPIVEGRAGVVPIQEKAEKSKSRVTSCERQSQELWFCRNQLICMLSAANEPQERGRHLATEKCPRLIKSRTRWILEMV